MYGALAPTCGLPIAGDYPVGDCAFAGVTYEILPLDFGPVVQSLSSRQTPCDASSASHIDLLY